MDHNQSEDIQTNIEKMSLKKEKRKRLKMKMSGKQLKNLQKIIIERGKKNK